MVGKTVSHQIDWYSGVGLSLVLSGMFYLLSAPSNFLPNRLPPILILGIPLATLSILIYLTRVRPPPHLSRTLITVLSLISFFVTFALLIILTTNGALQLQILILSLVHLPLICWLLVWWSETRAHPTPANRYAFLRLSLNYFVTAGLFIVIGSIFTGMSFALYQALGIDITLTLQRLFVAGGLGLVPISVLVMTYDPHLRPDKQSPLTGLGLVIQTLFRLLLILLILFLTVYLFLIPSHFSNPFYQREVLVIYNALVFMVLGVVVGVTPTAGVAVPPSLNTWLRRGVLWLITVTLLILAYALVALCYRLYHYGFTPNRAAILGWDLINLYLIGAAVLKLLSHPKDWHLVLHRQAAAALWPYMIWSCLVILGCSFIPIP